MLLSHGGLAEAFAESARMLMGDVEDVEAICLQPAEPVEEYEKKIEKVLKEQTEKGREVLILSDLFFGSPFNVTVNLSRKYRFQHITGMNLGVLLEALSLRGTAASGEELRTSLMAAAKDSIVDVNQMIMENT